MNFLAHLYLSGEDENIRFGNFVADWVKGKQYLKFPEGIQRGIILHRKIDSFTDSHSEVMKTKLKFREIYRKYAGIFVDVFYDHLLAKNWEVYSEKSLQLVANEFYLILVKKYKFLPERINYFLPHLIFSNRLVRYKTLQGFGESIKIMEKRAALPDCLPEAFQIIEEYKKEFETEFKLFFEDMLKQNFIIGAV